MGRNGLFATFLGVALGLGIAADAEAEAAPAPETITSVPRVSLDNERRKGGCPLSPRVTAWLNSATAGPDVRLDDGALPEDVTALDAIIAAADTNDEVALQALARTQGCGGANLLCLRSDGTCVNGLSNHKACGATVAVGVALQVKVLGWSKVIASERVHVTDVAQVSQNVVVNPELVAPGVGGRKLANLPRLTGVGLVPSVPPEVLFNYKSQVTAAGTVAVHIDFVRDAASGPPPDASQGMQDPAAAASAAYDVPVDAGRYYVDLGVMIPFTVDRQVTATANLATGERSLGVHYDARIIPAFVINVYPGGRGRGRVSSFETGATVWDAVGIQAGTGLGFGSHPAGEFYLGALFTPVAGLSLSAGLAIVNQQILPDGAQRGMLLPAGATFTPATQYMAEPYFGFSASLDLVDTIAKGFAKATGK